MFQVAWRFKDGKRDTKKFNKASNARRRIEELMGDPRVDLIAVAHPNMATMTWSCDPKTRRFSWTTVVTA